MANLNIKSDKDVIRKGMGKPCTGLLSQISCARGFPGALDSRPALCSGKHNAWGRGGLLGGSQMVVLKGDLCAGTCSRGVLFPHIDDSQSPRIHAPERIRACKLDLSRNIRACCHPGLVCSLGLEPRTVDPARLGQSQPRSESGVERQSGSWAHSCPVRVRPWDTFRTM